jgi:hypothetical protein
MNGQESRWTPGVEASPGAAAGPEYPTWEPQPTVETLQALATPQAPALVTPTIAGAAPAAGVGTLRAILLGDLGNAAPAAEPGRLDAIERRLDEMAAQVERAQAAARGGDVTLASLANLQRQVADLRQRAETVPIPRESVPPDADELAELWRQVEDLRRGQAHQTGVFLEEMRQVEARSQLRQWRARSANRIELMALRRHIYAPRTLRRTNAVLAARMPRPAGYATPHARPIAQPARRGGRRVAPQTGAEAWGDVWQALVAFLAAIWAMLALLGRMLGEDLKDAWIGLGELLRRG